MLATRAGWQVTALARDTDADFLSRTGVNPVTALTGPSFDAVLDAAVLLDSALATVRDGGSFVGVAPGAPVAAQRGIAVQTISVEPESDAISGLLKLAAEGTLEVRVAGRMPLREAGNAYDKVAGGGQRGRWLLIPLTRLGPIITRAPSRPPRRARSPGLWCALEPPCLVTQTARAGNRPRAAG